MDDVVKVVLKESLKLSSFLPICLKRPMWHYDNLDKHGMHTKNINVALLYKQMLRLF